MTAKYKTITIGPGSKFYFKDHLWEWVGGSTGPGGASEAHHSKKDENGFIYTHILKTGTIIIKLINSTEEEHQKENVAQNPTGRRMIQL